MQLALLGAKGLVTELDTERLVFMQADLQDPQLGLNAQAYDELASSTDSVIHNAQHVDFNRNFSSFKPAIDEVKNLISSCFASNQCTSLCKFLFISSMGTTTNLGLRNSLVTIRRSRSGGNGLESRSDWLWTVQVSL